MIPEYDMTTSEAIYYYSGGVQSPSVDSFYSVDEYLRTTLHCSPIEYVAYLIKFWEGRKKLEDPLAVLGMYNLIRHGDMLKRYKEWRENRAADLSITVLAQIRAFNLDIGYIYTPYEVLTGNTLQTSPVVRLALCLKHCPDKIKEVEDMFGYAAWELLLASEPFYLRALQDNGLNLTLEVYDAIRNKFTRA